MVVTYHRLTRGRGPLFFGLQEVQPFDPIPGYGGVTYMASVPEITPALKQWAKNCMDTAYYHNTIWDTPKVYRVKDIYGTAVLILVENSLDQIED